MARDVIADVYGRQGWVIGKTVAADIIAALADAGYAVVPREPTPAMMRAFWLAGPYPAEPFNKGYGAMIAAAQEQAR